MKGTVSDQHLQVLWFVPDVVLAERHYQIKKQVATLQSSVAKLERVLRCPFALKDEDIEQCITASINNQLEEHRLQVCSSDHSRIDWAALIDRAVSRQPPFDPEIEKGFRDAIILETFLQLVEASPKDRNACRSSLVMCDELLAKAAIARTSSSQNVEILQSIRRVEGTVQHAESDRAGGNGRDVENDCEGLFLRRTITQRSVQRVENRAKD